MRENSRQIIHLLVGLFFVYFTIFFGAETALFTAGSLAIVGIIFSFLVMNGVKIPLISFILSITERMHETDFPGKGAFKYLAGIMLTLAFSIFIGRPDIAAPALIPLAVGDAFATIIGMKIGRVPLFTKSLEGAAAFFVSSIVAFNLIFPGHFFGTLLASFLALMAELLPIEDNITVPLVAAITLSFIF